MCEDTVTHFIFFGIESKAGDTHKFVTLLFSLNKLVTLI